MASFDNTFDEYFQFVLNKVEMQTCQAEVHEIRKSAQEVIVKIWDAALRRKKKRFGLSESILVGSMEEGSRLFDANQFDFMMLLEMCDLSNDHIHVEPGCTYGFVKLQSSENGKQLHSWEFRKQLLSDLRKEGEGLVQEGNMKLVQRDFSVVMDPYWFERLMGKTEIEAWNMQLMWNNETISIDVMPALELEREKINLLEESLGKQIFRNEISRKLALTENRKCFLVARGCQKDDDDVGCGCWMMDFAPTEVALLNSMSQNHKACQRFLKYLIRFYTVLPSYMVKTTVLKHIEECKDDKSTKKCALEMLSYIWTCLDDVIMPDYFLKDVNIFEWKEAHHLKTSSQKTSMAILFEHHSRIFKMLCAMLEKMTEKWVSFSTPFTNSWYLVEEVLPLKCKLALTDEFFDEMNPDLDNFITKNLPSWSDIGELRKGTKPFFENMKWEPLKDFQEMQLINLHKTPRLLSLFQLNSYLFRWIVVVNSMQYQFKVINKKKIII